MVHLDASGIRNVQLRHRYRRFFVVVSFLTTLLAGCVSHSGAQLRRSNALVVEDGKEPDMPTSARLRLAERPFEKGYKATVFWWDRGSHSSTKSGNQFDDEPTTAAAGTDNRLISQTSGKSHKEIGSPEVSNAEQQNNYIADRSSYKDNRGDDATQTSTTSIWRAGASTADRKRRSSMSWLLATTLRMCKSYPDDCLHGGNAGGADGRRRSSLQRTAVTNQLQSDRFQNSAVGAGIRRRGFDTAASMLPMDFAEVFRKRRSSSVPQSIDELSNSSSSSNNLSGPMYNQ